MPRESRKAAHDGASDELILTLAKQFAECRLNDDEEGATAALNDIVEVYRQHKPAARQRICEMVAVASCTKIGYRYRREKAAINLKDIFDGEGPPGSDGDRVNHLFLRTSSGNIYLISRDSPNTTFQFTNAKSKISYDFPAHFPEDSALVIGSPFVAELLRDGKLVTRYTSPVVEAVFVNAHRSLNPQLVNKLTSEECSIVDDFGDAAGKIGSAQPDVEFVQSVLVDARTVMAFALRRASLYDLIMLASLPEGYGPMSEVFFRTVSGNIYRVERDTPSAGLIRLSDSRSTAKKSTSSERILKLDDITKTILEIGSAARLGPLTTSALKEIIVFNDSRPLSVEEANLLSSIPSSSIVEEYYGEVR